MELTTQITVISILVENQEEALTFYTAKIGLEKRLDMRFGPGLRFLTVAPKGQQRPEIALAKPDALWHSNEQLQLLRTQRGTQKPWVFDTDDCHRDYETLCARGVTFLYGPTKQVYGTEAVFADPYGNTFALLEVIPKARALFQNRRVGSAA
jgi:predicted enzyme related to lactoylglutathione lyase